MHVRDCNTIGDDHMVTSMGHCWHYTILVGPFRRVESTFQGLEIKCELSFKAFNPSNVEATFVQSTGTHIF